MLESRQLLAGDVAIELLDGNLVVVGDREDNVVAITADATPGNYIVAGFSDAEGVPTAIEGVANGEYLVEGVTGNVLVILGVGNDVLIITGAEFAGDVAVDTGMGNDGVFIGQRPELGETFEVA
jgi:hypothetical protein